MTSMAPIGSCSVQLEHLSTLVTSSTCHSCALIHSLTHGPHTAVFPTIFTGPSDLVFTPTQWFQRLGYLRDQLTTSQCALDAQGVPIPGECPCLLRYCRPLKFTNSPGLVTAFGFAAGTVENAVKSGQLSPMDAAGQQALLLSTFSTAVPQFAGQVRHSFCFQLLSHFFPSLPCQSLPCPPLPCLWLGGNLSLTKYFDLQEEFPAFVWTFVLVDAASVSGILGIPEPFASQVRRCIPCQ